MTSPGEDLARIEDALKRTRVHYRNQLLFGIVASAIFAYRAAARTTFDTFAWIYVALVAVDVLIGIGTVRGLVRMRTAAPVVTALRERPAEITKVDGSPPIRALPSGRYQPFLRIETASSMAKLRVTPAHMVALVDALRRHCPQATISVLNVPVRDVVPAPADAGG